MCEQFFPLTPVSVLDHLSEERSLPKPQSWPQSWPQPWPQPWSQPWPGRSATATATTRGAKQAATEATRATVKAGKATLLMVLAYDSMSLRTHNLLKSSKVSKFLEVFPSNGLFFFPVPMWPTNHAILLWIGPRRRGEHRPDRDRRDRHDERDRERQRERERMERPALERQRNLNELQSYFNFCTKMIKMKVDTCRIV